MLRTLIAAIALLLTAPAAWAQEEAEEAVEAAESGEAVDAADAGDAASEDEGPRTMSGMSILGNEEAPKALVIIPWKSSELGEDLSLSNTLDDRARPVDKDVFMRELSFYDIRSGE